MIEALETIKALAAIVAALAAENRPPSPEELAAAKAAQDAVEKRWSDLAPKV